MPEEVSPTPAGDTQPAAEPGAAAPQVVAVPVDVQPDVAPLAPDRTYTQKEWAEREAARDQEVAQYRQGIAQVALQAQIREAQAEEAQARAQDAQAVESGQLTDAEARQRQQQRYNALQGQFQAQQQQAAIQGQLADVQKVLAKAEQVGRLLAAQDLAEKYGVEAKELLAEKANTTFDKMEAAAAKLALRRARTGPERFDSGHMGGQGSNIDKMSPEEKVAFGLRQKR